MKEQSKEQSKAMKNYKGFTIEKRWFKGQETKITFSAKDAEGKINLENPSIKELKSWIDEIAG